MKRDPAALAREFRGQERELDLGGGDLGRGIASEPVPERGVEFQPRRLGRDFSFLVSSSWVSNIGDGFELAAHRVIGLLRDVVAEFGVEKTAQISTVDLGGGFGIAYLPQDDPPPIAEVAARLHSIVRDESAGAGLPCGSSGSPCSWLGQAMPPSAGCRPPRAWRVAPS